MGLTGERHRDGRACLACARVGGTSRTPSSTSSRGRPRTVRGGSGTRGGRACASLELTSAGSSPRGTYSTACAARRRATRASSWSNAFAEGAAVDETSSIWSSGKGTMTSLTRGNRPRRSSKTTSSTPLSARTNRLAPVPIATPDDNNEATSHGPSRVVPDSARVLLCAASIDCDSDI